GFATDVEAVGLAAIGVGGGRGRIGDAGADGLDRRELGRIGRLAGGGEGCLRAHRARINDGDGTSHVWVDSAEEVVASGLGELYFEAERALGRPGRARDVTLADQARGDVPGAVVRHGACRERVRKCGRVGRSRVAEGDGVRLRPWHRPANDGVGQHRCGVREVEVDRVAGLAAAGLEVDDRGRGWGRRCGGCAGGGGRTGCSGGGGWRVGHSRATEGKEGHSRERGYPHDEKGSTDFSQDTSPVLYQAESGVAGNTKPNIRPGSPRILRTLPPEW